MHRLSWSISLLEGSAGLLSIQNWREGRCCNLSIAIGRRELLVSWMGTAEAVN